MMHVNMKIYCFYNLSLYLVCLTEAYLEKCKLYHPDKHPGNKLMHEKFVKIKQAYDVLKDHQVGGTIPKSPNSQQESYNFYKNSNYYQKYRRRTATWDDVIREQQVRFSSKFKATLFIIQLT